MNNTIKTEIKEIRNADDFVASFDVSRETIERLQIYADLLAHWQKQINLIGSKTLDHIWHRHIADSAQLLRYAPEGAKSWIDLGSGGGAPGLVLAICNAEKPSFQIDLIESNAKKCAFLREVIRQTQVPARVFHCRIEAYAGEEGQAPYDIVTARALAPLPKLLTYAQSFLQKGAIGLFLKGQYVVEELSEATKYWELEMERASSITDSKGSVLIIKRAQHV